MRLLIIRQKCKPFSLASKIHGVFKESSEWVSDRVPFDCLQKLIEWLRHPCAKLSRHNPKGKKDTSRLERTWPKPEISGTSGWIIIYWESSSTNVKTQRQGTNSSVIIVGVEIVGKPFFYDGQSQLRQNFRSCVIWAPLEDGRVGVHKKKKKQKNHSKNYLKPKNRDRFRSKPKTAFKTIKTEDLHGSIFTKP